MTTSKETEVKVGYKSPIVMGSIGLLTLVFLGLLGRDGMVAFEISRANRFPSAPDVRYRLKPARSPCRIGDVRASRIFTFQGHKEPENPNLGFDCIWSRRCDGTAWLAGG